MTPRGLPDWNVQTGALAGSGFDVSENAARLGYPEVFNRLGRVIYWELFGDDISPWVVTTSGAGAGAALDATRYLWKPASFALTPGTDVGRFTQVSRRLPLTGDLKIGVATALYFASDNVDHTITLEVFNATATFRYRILVRGTGEVLYLDGDDNTFREQADIGNLGSANVFWVFVKFTVDGANGRYDRLQINEVVHDLSAINGRSLTFSEPVRLNIDLNVTDDQGGGDIGYIDFLTVTIDEP